MIENSMSGEWNRICYNAQCAVNELQTRMQVLANEPGGSSGIEHIKGRVKSFNSIISKMKEKNLSVNSYQLEKNITDLAGVRVVVLFEDDIDKVFHFIKNQADIEIIEIDDYIKVPKPSGYKSLHLLLKIPVHLLNKKEFVTVELQIRTMAMDFFASIEHKIKYKSETDINEQLSNELIQCSEIISDLDSKMFEINKKLISE